MKIAVITPYYRTELAWLQQCHASVKAQDHPCTHVLVADGEPVDSVDRFDAHHIISMGPNDDFGNTARNIGSIAAIRQGFDAICYLDADNWYRHDHVKRMVELHKRSGAAVCTSARTLHQLDGALLGPCYESDGEVFVDTNCLFLTREAFPIVSVWHMVDRRLDSMGDRVVWFQVKKLGLTTAYDSEPTLCYRTNFREHYQHFNATPPSGAKTGYQLYPSRKLFEGLKASALGQDLPFDSNDGMLPRFSRDRHVLVSLIGVPRPQLDPMLVGIAEDCAAEGKIPVLIVDAVDLAVRLSRDFLVEHLPSAGSRDVLAPDLEWDRYLDRRLRQIKEKWSSGHVIALGLPLDGPGGSLDAAPEHGTPGSSKTSSVA